ncbi:17384_t:CDS:2, partial [Racocetra fulgida]
GPCVIKICKGKTSTLRTVTGLVLSQETKSKTLPDYVKENNVICLTCYNAIVVNASSEFQMHVLDSHSHIEAEISNQPTFLSFSQAVELITNVLYEREYNSMLTQPRHLIHYISLLFCLIQLELNQQFQA